MTSALERDLVYLFAGLLALAAVLLAFFPLLRHVWIYSVSRRTFAVVLAAVVAVAVGAVVLVRSAEADPEDFLPIIAITVAFRLASPSLLYLGVRDRFDTERFWPIGRGALLPAFLGLASLLAYDVAILSTGGEPAGVAVVSEQLIMALSASFLVVRVALHGRPRESTEAWPLWAAAVLLALAFVVVVPYAVPSFALAYATSGLAGWIIAVAILVWDR